MKRATHWRQKPKGRSVRAALRSGIRIWLRGLDLNQRPSGYEPDELPGCSTPRGVLMIYALWMACLGAVGLDRVGWKTWRRPTFPRLETQYHRRWGFSRPSSGWDRVYAPRQSHQVIQPTRSSSGLRPRTRVGEFRFWQIEGGAAGDPPPNLVCVCIEN